MKIRINTTNEYTLYNRANIKYDKTIDNKVLTFMIKINDGDNGESIFDTVLDNLKNLKFLTLVRDGEEDVDWSNYSVIQSFSRIFIDGDDYIMVSLIYKGDA